MSRDNITINDSILMQFIKPSFNFASLKARLRLKELKRNFSDSQYKKFFKKGFNINSVSSSMNKKYSVNDLYNSERKNSVQINRELQQIKKRLNFFKKNYKIKNNKYKLKLYDDSKEKEKIKNDNLIKSVKEDIFKYLKELHMINDSKFKNKRLQFGELKLNLRPIIRTKIKKNSAIYKNFDTFKFLNDVSQNNKKSDVKENVNKNRINKFISIEGNSESLIKFKYKFNDINEQNGNEEEKSSRKNIFNPKIFPFLRQNSYVPFFNQDKMNNQFQFKNERYINLPNI